jgi:hypothetical protein
MMAVLRLTTASCLVLQQLLLLSPTTTAGITQPDDGSSGGGSSSRRSGVAPPITSSSSSSSRNYDVLVYGATSGGVVAAVAAAREGATVALLDPGKRIGGMSAGGLSSTDVGNSQVIGGMAHEFYVDNGKHYNMSEPEYMLEPHVALNVFHNLIDRANVSLFSSARVATVKKMGTRLKSLVTTDGRIFSAGVFIEADYEGDLMARADISYAVGREGVAKYNESLNGVRLGNKGHEFSVMVDPFVNGSKRDVLPMVNPFDFSVPGQADKKVQAYNFRLCVTTDAANKIPFSKPVGYDPHYWELARRYFTIPEISRCVRAPSGNVAGCQRNENGEWYQPEGDDAGEQYSAGLRDHRGADLNNGGPISTDFVGGSWRYPEANYSEREKIVEAHKLYTQSFLWFMSTDPALNISIRRNFQKFGLCADEFNETHNWPPDLYVRAARRMVGRQVFTQNTPRLNRSWGNESIGCGSYNFDSHTAERIACPNASTCGLGPAGIDPTVGYAWMEGDVETGPGVYDIPMYVLLPKRGEATNMLVVATPSASHIGMSTLRMEPQFMIMGQSAGVIAALALQTVLLQGEAIHDVDRVVLHQRLLDTKQLMNEDCKVPSPAPPPAPHAARYIVSGAGTASCNGVYMFDPTNHRDRGTAFYSKSSGGHQIYRSGGVWRIAHGLKVPNFLWYTSSVTGGISPPSNGWEVAGKGMTPTPTVKVGKFDSLDGG